jgi:hypothetical protein
VFTPKITRSLLFIYRISLHDSVDSVNAVPVCKCAINEHLDGKVAEGFLENAETLLCGAPEMEKFDVLAVKVIIWCNLCDKGKHIVHTCL